MSKLNIFVSHLKGGKLLFLCLAGLLALVFSACARSAPTYWSPGSIQTLAAQTADAMMTQNAISTLVLPTQLPTVTDQPKELPTSTSSAPIGTLPPSATPLPPTATPVPPTPTATPIPCDWAQFVKDVTVEDNSSLATNASFKKTWRLKNIGTCTWTTAYSLVFVKGDQMNGAAAVAIPGEVKPGQTIDLSVDLKAPSKPGTYQGFWMLRNPAGVIFGLGQGEDGNFWVRIKAYQPEAVKPFTETYCSATWSNATTTLSCPGDSGSAAGSVKLLDKPAMENGTVDDEAALWVRPQMVDNGIIMGKFPAVTINEGDHFKTVIGCLKDEKDCNVMFQLNYQIGNGAIQNLGTWTEIYDQKINKLDVDLSSLAGKSVTLILYASANGSSNGDSAFWLLPRITQ